MISSSKDLLTWLQQAQALAYSVAEQHLHIPRGEINYPLLKIDFEREHVLASTPFPVIGIELALQLLDYFPNTKYGLKIVAGGEVPECCGYLPPAPYDKYPMSTNITQTGIIWAYKKESGWLSQPGNWVAAQKIAEHCTLSIYSTETSEYQRLMVAPYQGLAGILIARPELILGKSLFDTSVISPEKIKIHDRVCGAIVKAIREADNAADGTVATASYTAEWEGVTWHKVVEAWSLGNKEVAVVTRNEYPAQYDEFKEILSRLN